MTSTSTPTKTSRAQVRWHCAVVQQDVRCHNVRCMPGVLASSYKHHAINLSFQKPEVPVPVGVHTSHSCGGAAGMAPYCRGQGVHAVLLLLLIVVRLRAVMVVSTTLVLHCL